MYYKESFKQLMLDTAKGFGAGLLVSIILNILMKGDITIVIAFTLVFGPVASMIFCSLDNIDGFMSNSVIKIFTGIKDIFFGGLFAGSGFFFVIGIIKLVIGVIVMIPLAIYMAINYILNLIYFTVMFLLEKFNKLQGKEDLCTKLDKIVPITSIVISVILCIKFFSTVA